MIEFEIRWVKTLACALALTVPAMVLAQSADLLRAYQNFETAKAANKVPEALKYGNEAVKLTEDGGDKQSVIELLRNLGDFAAQAGQDQPAAEYYTRALAAQESVLGPDHPDLVPALTALADLKLKDKRYAEAAALEQRILDIERQAYGEHHENVLATLNKLREIYRAGGDAAGVTRIDGEVRAWSPPSALPPPPPAGERGLPGIPGGIAGADRRYRQNQQGFATVRVFYGTNRAPTGDVKPALFYGKERGELQYGSLNVTIPRIHKEAELETQPRWAEYTFVMNERIRPPRICSSSCTDSTIPSRTQPAAPPRWPTTWISTVRRSSTAGRRRAVWWLMPPTKPRWASAAGRWPTSSRPWWLNPVRNASMCLPTAWATAH